MKAIHGYSQPIYVFWKFEIRSIPKGLMPTNVIKTLRNWWFLLFKKKFHNIGDSTTRHRIPVSVTRDHLDGWSVKYNKEPRLGNKNHNRNHLQTRSNKSIIKSRSCAMRMNRNWFSRAFEKTMDIYRNPFIALHQWHHVVNHT